MPKGAEKSSSTAFFRARGGNLHAQIDGDGGGANATFRTHDHDQLFNRALFGGLTFEMETQQNLANRFGTHGLGQEVLHTAAHGVE